MATVLKVYKVIFHWVTGATTSPDTLDGPHHAFLEATANDYNSLLTVINASSTLKKPGTLVIDSCDEVGHGDVAKA